MASEQGPRAAGMQPREALGVGGRERQAGLLAGDRLVLGAVVLEHALQVPHPRDQPQVAEEDADPDDLLDDHEDQRVGQRIPEQARDTGGEQEEERVQSLVKIYEGMKPKEAGRIFETLDIDTLLLVAERMKERKLAPIMAAIDPEKAKELTVKISTGRKLPTPGAGS